MMLVKDIKIMGKDAGLHTFINKVPVEIISACVLGEVVFQDKREYRGQFVKGKYVDYDAHNVQSNSSMMTIGAERYVWEWKMYKDYNGEYPKFKFNKVALSYAYALGHDIIRDDTGIQTAKDITTLNKDEEAILNKEEMKEIRYFLRRYENKAEAIKVIGDKIDYDKLSKEHKYRSWREVLPTAKEIKNKEILPGETFREWFDVASADYDENTSLDYINIAIPYLQTEKEGHDGIVDEKIKHPMLRINILAHKAKVKKIDTFISMLERLGVKSFKQAVWYQGGGIDTLPDGVDYANRITWVEKEDNPFW